jgi:hypothetical protein
MFRRACLERRALIPLTLSPALSLRGSSWRLHLARRSGHDRVFLSDGASGRICSVPSAFPTTPTPGTSRAREYSLRHNRPARRRNPRLLYRFVPIGHAHSRSTAPPRSHRSSPDGSIRRFRVDQATTRHLVAASRDRRLSACGRPCPCAGHEMAHGALGSQAMPIQARFAGLHVIRRIRNPI